MTDQELFDLQNAVARAIAKEQDPAKKAELQAHLAQLERDSDRLLTIDSQAAADELKGPIARVEEIVRDLQDQTILDALAAIRDSLGIEPDAAPQDQPAAGAPEDQAGANIGGPIPGDWMPDAPMTRIICHWTAGRHQASDSDREHYHILIEADGNLVRGRFAISDNVGQLIWEPRNYAAHTKGTNSRAIGVSVCCMRDAEEGPPFSGGPDPMTEVQWNRMIDVVAQLCARYEIAVTPTTVLGHGEVQAKIGNPQDGKWDPLVLPWDTSKSKAEVGDLLRARVTAVLEG